MDQFLGALTTVALGVIGVGALYQLSTPGGNNLVGTGGAVINNTVNNGLFKGSGGAKAA